MDVAVRRCRRIDRHAADRIEHTVLQDSVAVPGVR
jgi:hypothetical protein